MMITTSSFQTLENLDRVLAQGGVAPMSPFWRETLRRFYEHPTARILVPRVGRRGGKGLTVVKIAINEALFGDHKIPPGEMHRFAFVSVSKDEAAERLRMIEKCLRILEIGFRRAGDEVLIDDAQVAFRVCAATVAATSGFTCIGASIDEAAKLGDHDSADPVEEVFASVIAMTATHPGARLVLQSSPWGVDDFHARKFDAGDTDEQLTAYAPSWIANPRLTEQGTRRGITDLQWEREWLAVPGDTDTTAFGSKDVLAAFSRPVDPAEGERWILIDSSQLRGQDDFAMAVAAPAVGGGLAILEIDGLNQGTMPDAVARIVALARKHGATRVFGDRYESGGLEALLSRAGLTLSTPPWTVQSKHNAGAIVGRLFREGAIALPEHSRMRNQLVTLKARLRQNGLFDYPTNGRDYAALLFALGVAIDAGEIPADALEIDGAPTEAQLEEATRQLASVQPSHEFGGPDTDRAIVLDAEDRLNLAAAQAIERAYPVPVYSEPKEIGPGELAKYYQARLAQAAAVEPPRPERTAPPPKPPSILDR